MEPRSAAKEGGRFADCVVAPFVSHRPGVSNLEYDAAVYLRLMTDHYAEVNGCATSDSIRF